MESIAEGLIAIATAFKALDPASQVVWVLGVLSPTISLLFGIFYTLHRWSKARESKYVTIASQARRDLVAAEKAVDELSEEVKRLKEYDSSTILHRLEVDDRDGNRGLMIRTADAYLNHHRAAFERSCAILAKHHLTRFEDGFAALDRARIAAMGALAANPSHIEHQQMLEEIEALIRVEATKPEDREARKAQEERIRLRKQLEETEGDIKALMSIGISESVEGRHLNALAFFERSESEYFQSKGSMFNPEDEIAIKDCIANELYFSGNLVNAKDVARNISRRSARILGEDHPLTRSLKLTLSRATLDLGFPKEAEEMILELLAYCQKHLPSDDQETLRITQLYGRLLLGLDRPEEAEKTFRELIVAQKNASDTNIVGIILTKHLHANSLLALGRVREANSKYENLLSHINDPKIYNHPHILTVRASHADAILALRDASTAEEKLNELLPLLDKTHSRQHPTSIKVRILLALARFFDGHLLVAQKILQNMLSQVSETYGSTDARSRLIVHMLVRICLELGEADKAREYLDTLQISDLDSRAFRGSITTLRGWLADFDGEPEKAEAFLLEAEAQLSHFPPEAPPRRDLSVYMKTRSPGAPGGTMLQISQRA